MHPAEATRNFKVGGRRRTNGLNVDTPPVSPPGGRVQVGTRGWSTPPWTGAGRYERGGAPPSEGSRSTVLRHPSEHRLRPRVSALLRATGRRISSAGTVASFRLRPIGDAGLTIAVAMAIARAIVHAAPGARDTFSGARTIPDELGLYDAHLARRRGGAACVDTSPRPFGGLDEGARR